MNCDRGARAGPTENGLADSNSKIHLELYILIGNFSLNAFKIATQLLNAFQIAFRILLMGAKRI